MESPVIGARERRAELQRKARAIGIDEAYVSRLVDTFYQSVRTDPRLGPIFDDVIQNRWDHHLPRMKDFWASVALHAGTYSGQPVPAHVKLTRVEQSDFQIWLRLFREALEQTAPTPEAIDYFMERAHRIAESLQLAMFGLPGLPRRRER
jgi:hemoglobin